METSNLNNVMETLNNVSKMAANLSEKKEVIPQNVNPDNSNNSNPNQNVNIRIGEQEKKKKEKPAETHTHIHHDFPENREMSKDECELALAKAKLEHDKHLEDHDFERWKMMKEHEWNEQIRKENRERADKAAKTRKTIGAIFAAIGTALLGYSIWDSHKHPERNHASLHISYGNPTPGMPEMPDIPGEGTVE